MFAFVVCCLSLQLVCAAGLDAVQLQEGESEITNKWSGDRRVVGPAPSAVACGGSPSRPRPFPAHLCVCVLLQLYDEPTEVIDLRVFSSVKSSEDFTNRTHSFDVYSSDMVRSDAATGSARTERRCVSDVRTRASSFSSLAHVNGCACRCFDFVVHLVCSGVLDGCVFGEREGGLDPRHRSRHRHLANQVVAGR